METALRYELIKAIPELANSIYPTNAPEGVLKPYLVYMRTSTDNLKTLEGYSLNGSNGYMFSIMAGRYSDMLRIRKEVEELIKTFPKTLIGDTEKIFIQDVDIKNITEQYEHELKVNRGIIDFQLYY